MAFEEVDAIVCYGDEAIETSKKVYRVEGGFFGEVERGKLAWELLFLNVAYFGSGEAAKVFFEALDADRREVELLASDYRDLGARVVGNILANVERRGSPGMALKGIFKGKPAVICGAGRSWDVERLKKWQGKALIIAAGSAIKLFAEAGIEPTICCAVDPEPPPERFFPFEVPFFYQHRYDRDLLAQVKGDLFWMPDNGGYPIEAYLLGESEPFDGGWNAATFGVAIADHLGCAPISLMGVDLVDGPRDWIVAKEWLSRRRVDQNMVLEEKHSFTFPKGQGEDVGEKVLEVRRSLLRVEELSKRLLELCERLPEGKGEYLVCEYEIAEEIGYRYIIERVWEVWQRPLLRSVEKPLDRLIHKWLFIQRICREVR